MEVVDKMVGERRGDEVKPVAAIEGLEGSQSRLSMASSTWTTQWLLRLVAWSRWPVASLCELQHDMREKLLCSLRWLGTAVPAGAVVLDKDKDSAKPMGARYAKVCMFGSMRRLRGAWRGEVGGAWRAQAWRSMRMKMTQVQGGAR
jgi:hypothetical protein